MFLDPLPGKFIFKELHHNSFLFLKTIVKITEDRTGLQSFNSSCLFVVYQESRASLSTQQHAAKSRG